MKIVILHSGNNGFFPRFYNYLFDSIKSTGNVAYLLSSRTGMNRRCILRNQIFWGTFTNWHIHHLIYKVTGIQDIFSFVSTLDLIRKISIIAPDIIHFHILNECIINFPLLVWYINKKKIPVVWTMHDCRVFTGRCPYFDEVNCNLWKTGCGKCPDKQYDPSIIDNTALLWRIRKHVILKLKKLTIVTPSKWLYSLVKQSFLSGYDCNVIHNGIDASLFEKKDDNLKRRIGIKEDKYVVLGIASAWTDRKGLDSFEKLVSILPSNYQIVLVGSLPYLIDGIINLPKTSDIDVISSYFNFADVFVNPTKADNFPTTNIEALASGTPVVTYNTGGSAECLDLNSGISVPKGNVEELANAIYRVCETKNKYTSEQCKQRANQFSLEQYLKYVNLYNNIINTNE